MFKCPHCKKDSGVKAGVRKNKIGLVQRFICTECGKYFVRREGFARFRNRPEVITAALDLRAKGLSLADVVDHLEQHHQVKVSRTTILAWQNKFGKKLSSFTQTLLPRLGSIYHADEVFLKVSGVFNYYWDCIDYLTKFIVADHFSIERNDNEATQFLEKIKSNSPEIPDEIHTDNSYDYETAFRRVFPRRKIHKHFPAWKMKFKNNPIERFHNTVKQRYKTFRGFDNPKSAENFLIFFRIYYNFIRKHLSLGRMTPAQAAEISLELGRNRFLGLIKMRLFNSCSFVL